MRRLSVAQDRELRCVSEFRVALRLLFSTNAPYAWCRDHHKRVDRQMERLQELGYIEKYGRYTIADHCTITPEGRVYLERFPR